MNTASEKPLYTVLAVDDEPMFLELTGKFLAWKGFRAVTTTDPESVVALAKVEQPRLIISDIHMPGMDGLTLVRKLKEDRETAEIPIILLTSSTTVEHVEDGLSSGVEAYLVKPLDWEADWPKILAVLLRQ